MSNAHLTSNSQIAYPFVDDAPGLVRDGTAVMPGTAFLPLDFFVDAVAVLGAGDGTLCLSSILRVGNSFTFTFKDVSGTTVVSNVKALASLPAAFGVLTFETLTGDANTSSSLRIVTGETFLATMTAMPAGTISYAAALQFSQGVVEYRPERVTGLRVAGHDITDICGLVEGYNCGLSAAANPLQAPGAHATQIGVELSPGLGLGKYDPCDNPDPVEYLARINGVGPDEEGNIMLVPGECYNLLADADNNRMYLDNVCLPCCDCQDYANTVTYLAGALTELETIHQRIDGVIASMNYWITDPVVGYNVRIKARKGFTLSLTGTIGYDGACVPTPRKVPTTCMLIIRITNGHGEDRGPITAALDAHPDDDPDSDYTADACWISWQLPGGAWKSRRNILFFDEMLAGSAKIDSIKAGSTVLITCRMRVTTGSAAGSATVTVIDATTEEFPDDYGATGAWEGEPTYLAMAVVGSGTTVPAVGEHVAELDAPFAIEAVPAVGWNFNLWSATLAAVIADPADPTTNVTPVADATVVTATFTET